MKNTLITSIIIFLFINVSFGQWTGGTSTTVDITRTGNVGIGVSGALTERLVLGGNLRFANQSNYSLSGNITNGVFSITPAGSSSQGPFIEMYGGTSSSNAGNLTLGCFGNSGNINFVSYTAANSWQLRARITSDGKMVIGDANPNTAGKYKLYVADGILTEQVKVAIKTTNDWSDFVFKKDYKLMPLKMLEKYIEVNQHLPNVPSAAEVVEEGVNMAKMDATLLQKIEELTLYTIELNKQLEQLQQKILTLEQAKN